MLGLLVDLAVVSNKNQTANESKQQKTKYGRKVIK